MLRIDGNVGDDQRTLLVAIGEAAQEKHQIRAGDRVRGEGVPVADPEIEIAELYKVSKLVVIERGVEATMPSPPWLGVPLSTSAAREVIGGLTRELSRTSARLASGDAACRSR